jgi:hypothetical protein
MVEMTLSQWQDGDSVPATVPNLGHQDRVERGGELRIPITDEKPELADMVLQNHEQTAGLLG